MLQDSEICSQPFLVGQGEEQPINETHIKEFSGRYASEASRGRLGRKSHKTSGMSRLFLCAASTQIGQKIRGTNGTFPWDKRDAFAEWFTGPNMEASHQKFFVFVDCFFFQLDKPPLPPPDYYDNASKVVTPSGVLEWVLST